ncbi:hypothetical protein CYLTODRAFT_450877 [Cylindrobasidium torrendii FP15055 ss-10]|uniref:Uncharacterized protein n=1 Tax=Cylindrobasidium torrendii FP15055 ss-10 TaxID=1314674 RepID=A0A0D7BLQ8_9AGAR|nr:hypothetical protein CYLTODRAFT_450877 [Cylindrobasidium torrendii FP15055 ss-10]
MNAPEYSSTPDCMALGNMLPTLPWCEEPTTYGTLFDAAGSDAMTRVMGALENWIVCIILQKYECLADATTQRYHEARYLPQAVADVVNASYQTPSALFYTIVFLLQLATTDSKNSSASAGAWYTESSSGTYIHIALTVRMCYILALEVLNETAALPQPTLHEKMDFCHMDSLTDYMFLRCYVKESLKGYYPHGRYSIALSDGARSCWNSRLSRFVKFAPKGSKRIITSFLDLASLESTYKNAPLRKLCGVLFRVSRMPDAMRHGYWRPHPPSTIKTVEIERPKPFRPINIDWMEEQAEMMV